MNAELEMETCKHDGMRNAVTYPVCPRSFTQQKIEWCSECGKLLRDDTWKVPLPGEVTPQKQINDRLLAIAKLLKAHEWKIPVAERAPLFLDDTIKSLEQLDKPNDKDTSDS